MKILIILMLVCLQNLISFSQWQYDTTLPYSVNEPIIWQICVIDTSVSWAFGNVTIGQNLDAPYLAKRNKRGWSEVLLPEIQTIKAYSFTTVDSQKVWIGTSYPKEIYFSSNGGLNWTLQYHISGTANVEGIMFSKQYPYLGYAIADIGLNGMFDGVYILKTTNTGQNWQKWVFEIPNYVASAYSGSSMAIVDTNFIWFGIGNMFSDSSKIIMSSTGGLNWNIIDIDAGQNGPETIQFLDQNTGLCIGNHGSNSSNIYRTTNSGLNWSSIYNFGYYYYSETMRWIPGTNNIYSHDNSSIITSKDGGLSWSFMTGGPGSYLHSIDAIRINDRTIYALLVTGLRQVYKLLDTARVIGIKNHGIELPKHFALYQNYPNPFNPSTTIKYDVTREGLVNIKVYDIIGRSIATLVNEKKQPGSYEVTWNAGNYPSGVYFYKLETAEFSVTKKLVLIK